MGKVVKRMAVAVGLCLFMGLQSLSSVQAAVNYEACPFCGTEVERYTERKLAYSVYRGMCKEHSDCLLYTDIYDRYDVVQCQTPGCPINHESEHEEYVLAVPRHVPRN